MPAALSLAERGERYVGNRGRGAEENRSGTAGQPQGIKDDRRDCAGPYYHHRDAVVAIVSIFNGDIEIDTNELQRMVVENLSAEEQAKLQFVEDTMYAIEREMKASGFSDPRVTEAQVLFTLSLYDYAQEADFVSKLVGCFASEQTDEQLIAAVNAAFGTAISAEEFSQVMGAIRSVYIDTSGYIDPCTKNNLDLVEWANRPSSGAGDMCGAPMGKC